MMMDTEELKQQIAANITSFRKQSQMTQAELAVKLNYSDKAVSKWERGDSLPDVATLVLLAQVLGITVNQLIYPPESIPEPEPVPAQPAKTTKLTKKRGSIACLSSVLVWFIALLVYVVLSGCHLPGSWVGFVVCIPVNAIVLLSLLSAWQYFRWNQVLISLIMWGFIGSLFIILWVYAGLCLPRMFLLGAPGQLAIWLWFRMLQKEE